MSKLYVVATPIGNLEDITYRAIKTLQEVEVIFCEDTRFTKKLLDRYEISKKCFSYNAHSTEKDEEKILNFLKEGNDIALVSDAGTPCISDPGVRIISKILEVLPETEIIPIVGASAVTAIASVAGFSMMPYTFMGFVPHKKGRNKFFEKINQTEHSVVFYESPHRVIKTLESLNEIFPERKMVVGRELTKMYEQIIRGKTKEVLQYFQNNSAKIKGEFVLIIAPR